MSDGLQSIIPFDNPVNFDFPAAEIEVLGAPDSLARLRQNINLTVAALYGASIDLDISRDGGILTGTASGGAVIDGAGNLDLKGGTAKFVDYDDIGNVDQSLLQGAMRIRWTPNFNGFPPSVHTLCQISRSANNNNAISVENSAGGALIRIFANNGSVIVSSFVGFLVAVSGVLTEWELNWDISTGQTRLFIDGVQAGATQTGTGTRNPSVDFLRVGSNRVGTGVADYTVDEVAVFDSVQHTAPYTPGVAGLILSKANPIIKPNLLVQVTAFKGFSAVTDPEPALPNADQVRFVIEVDGQAKWFDTGLGTPAWVDSDSTFAQSNTETEVTDNIVALSEVLSPSGSNVRPLAILHSEDGITLPGPTITSTTLKIDFDQPSTTAPIECFIFGVALDAAGLPEPGAVVFIDHPGFLHGDNFIQGKRISTVADSIGEFQLQVVETESISLAPYTMRIGSRRFTKVQVPNQATVSIGDLLPQLAQA